MKRSDVKQATQRLSVYADRVQPIDLPGFQKVLVVTWSGGGTRWFYDLPSVLDYCEVQRLNRKIAHGCTDAYCKECDI